MAFALTMWMLFAAAAPKPDVPVRAVLDAQVAAWNRGDLEGYMDGYWRSPELTFFSNSSVTHGWQQTLDRYKERYQSGGHEMGKLTFSGLEVRMLSVDSAFVSGQWRLHMSDGKEPHGNFTLLFRKMAGKWRIVLDHSSGE